MVPRFARYVPVPIEGSLLFTYASVITESSPHLRLTPTTIIKKCRASFSLGTTNVKSMRLDKWTPEQIAQTQTFGGNKMINADLEWHVPANYSKPGPHSSGEERRAYIRAKYVDRLFDKARGLPRKDPVSASSRRMTRSLSRPQSFMEGRMEFVGVLDITCVETRTLKRPAFVSRHVSGGYFVVGTLGKICARTAHSVAGDFSRSVLKFSWDGASHLLLELFLGTKRLGRADVNLASILQRQNDQPVSFWVDFLSLKSKSIVGSVKLSCNFVDLR